MRKPSPQKAFKKTYLFNLFFIFLLACSTTAYAITTQCNDGIDNDSDNGIDQEDPGCWSNPSRRATYDATRNDESQADFIAKAQLIAPASNAEISNTKPKFIWQAVPRAVKYELEVKYERPGGGRIRVILERNLTVTNFTPLTDLVLGSYRWRVRAVGSKGEANWSPTFRFIIHPQCRDNIDNDTDGLIDGLDPGCTAIDDNDESDGTSQCQDGIDNDLDSLTDFGADPDCQSAQDNSESSEDKRYVCKITEDFSSGTLGNVELFTSGAASAGCNFQIISGVLHTSCPDNGIYRITLKNSPSHDSANIVLSANIRNDNWKDKNGPGIGLQTRDVFGYQLSGPYTPNGTKRGNSKGLVIYDIPFQNVYGPKGTVNLLEGQEFRYVANIGSDQATTLEVFDLAGNKVDGINAGILPHRGWTLGVRCAEADCQVDNIEARIVSKAPIACAPLPTQCSDGLDNDNNGRIDLQDPGCSSLEDQEELGFTPQCSDGLDNDGDNVVDSLDPGCYTDPNDSTTYDKGRDDESLATTQCQDTLDNETDGLVDLADPGCINIQDNDESDATSQCQDGVDNDGDGAVDLADFSCSSPQDNDEALPLAPCQDAIDNDGDNLIDATDPGCRFNPSDPNSAYNPNGSSEVNLVINAVGLCNDGLDNDNDGLVDSNDPDCWTNPSDSTTYDANHPNGEVSAQFGPCSTNVMAIRYTTNLATIEVHEQSGQVVSFAFPKDSAEVGSDITLSDTVNDFSSSESEYFDLFISNSSAVLDPNGSYVTIQALSNASTGLAHNIDAVYLVFNDGTKVPADIVTRVVPGSNLTNAALSASGFAKFALGAADNTATVLGNGLTSITVGFCSTLEGTCNAGETCTCDEENNISSTLIQTRGDDQYQFILDSVNNVRTNKVFKENRRVRHNAKRRRRRGFIRIEKLHNLLTEIPGILFTSCPADVLCTSASNVAFIEQATNLITQLWKIGRNNTRMERRQGLLSKSEAQARFELAEQYRDVRLNALAAVPDTYLSCQ